MLWFRVVIGKNCRSALDAAIVQEFKRRNGTPATTGYLDLRAERP
jgi:hypothetical protein